MKANHFWQAPGHCKQGLSQKVMGSGKFIYFVKQAIPLNQLNQDDLKTAIEKVLTDSSYRENAVKIQQAIRKAGGVSRAADVIEQAVSTREPVLANY